MTQLERMLVLILILLIFLVVNLLIMLTLAFYPQLELHKTLQRNLCASQDENAQALLHNQPF